jgi:hypothetical protein
MRRRENGVARPTLFSDSIGIECPSRSYAAYARGQTIVKLTVRTALRPFGEAAIATRR